jgi:Tfp pilus assembly protein PilN
MIKINLLPPDKRKRLKKVKPSAPKAGPSLPKFKLDLKYDPVVVMAAGLALIVTLGVGGGQFWLSRKQSALEERRSQARAELVHMNQIVMRIDELRNTTREVTRKMDIIQEVDRNRYIWPRLLDEISGALPQYAWLENVSETSPFPNLWIRIEGLTMSNLLLGQLMERLEKSPLISRVSLISSTERREGSYDTKYFIIECACELNESTDTTHVAAAAGR